MNERNDRAGLSLAKFLEEKGFYMILFLCVTAMGIAGYVFFFADQGAAAPVSGGGGTSADILANWTTAALPSLSGEEDEAVFGKSTTSAATKPPAATSASAPATTAATTTTPPATTKAKATSETTAASKAADFFVRPLPGEVMGAFSGDELVYDRTNGDWRTHNGVDFAASDGDKVYAIADGRIADVYADDFYGTSILLDHGGGLQTVYTGLGATLSVEEGQEVSAGDVLGMLEASILFESALPVHLHLEMLQDGVRIDPMSLIPG